MIFSYLSVLVMASWLCRYNITKTFQLSIEKFVSVLTFLELEDVDSAEVECILANLIYLGRIKGYISHQHNKLVVSKQNAFPSLSAAS